MWVIFYDKFYSYILAQILFIYFSSDFNVLDFIDIFVSCWKWNSWNENNVVTCFLQNKNKNQNDKFSMLHFKFDMGLVLFLVPYYNKNTNKYLEDIIESEKNNRYMFGGAISKIILLVITFCFFFFKVM